MSADLCGAGTFASVEEAVTFAAVTAFLNLGDRERIAVTGSDGYIDTPIDHEIFVGRSSDSYPNGSRGGARRQKRSDFGPRGRRPAR